MSRGKQSLRHLPPSAVPITMADLQAGLGASPQANDAFRAEIAAHYAISVNACYLASSGRTVLYTLLKGLAADHRGRRQVVMPAYTCPVLPKVALDLDLEPVYVDIWPETTRYKQALLGEAISAQTLAVFLVHPFGIPLPADDVLKSARQAGAAVIEDAAQSMGARWANQPVGLAGDFGLFSLGPGKPLSTGGGGIVISGQPAEAAALARWWAELPPASGLNSTQAWMRQASFRLAFHPRGWWAATRLGLQRLGNHEDSWGYKIRDLSSAQAEIGRALLPRLDEINDRRRAVALRLIRAVNESTSLQSMTYAHEAEPIFLRLPILAQSEGQREALFAKLWAAGIGAGRMYEKTLPAIFDPKNQHAFPGAEDYARRLLTLPTHYHVSENDIQIMEEILAG